MLSRSYSELEHTSALRADARRGEGWIAAGGALTRSGGVIAAPLWLGRGQACTEIQLAAGEPFDDQHDAGTVGTAQAGCLGRIDAGRRAQQSAAAFERSTPSAVGEESEVADANQASRQDVKQEGVPSENGQNRTPRENAR